MKSETNILDEVTRTSIQLLLKEPFYSHVLSCLNKYVVGEGHEVDTMAVGFMEGNHTLFVNEKFWSEFLVAPKYRYGVLKHEILHIIFKHTLVNEPNKDPFLVNIAMDLVVNQYVARDYLPEESIFLETFPDLQLEAEKSWPYYYEKLASFQRKGNSQNGNTSSAKNLEKIKGGGFGLERHELWKENAVMSEIDKALMESFIDNIIQIAHQKTPAKFWGNMPAGIKLQIEKMIKREVAQIHWRRMIKLFSASSNKTKIKNSLKRRSKRYGTVPGIKIKRKHKIFVALDTSGSITKQELESFFSEIYFLWRSGALICIGECDTKLKRIYEFKGQLPDFVIGRGGTEFNDPIRYANEVLKADGLIFFTDAYGPVPEVPARCPILWVITKDGLPLDDENLQLFPGRKTKLQI